MKPNYLTILITTLCIFFNACHNSNTAPQLQLADSLIDKRADSALCILEKLSIEEISNKSAKAMYALLLTEALDKNFKSHRNDSLILIAVDYYKDNSNNKLKTKAYYYLGRVYQDNKDYVKATEAYLTALKTASPNQAPILQIYNNLALCYESQEFYLPAIKTYKESYATAEKMQDKYGILHATRGLDDDVSVGHSVFNGIRRSSAGHDVRTHNQHGDHRKDRPREKRQHHAGARRIVCVFFAVVGIFPCHVGIDAHARPHCQRNDNQL